MTEVFVAAGLCIAVMGLLGVSAVRETRQWIELRQRQIALDELVDAASRIRSNGFTGLSKLTGPSEPGDSAVDSGEDDVVPVATLKVRELTRRQLPECRLSVERFPDEADTRVRLSLDWRRRGDPPPLRLTIWIDGRIGDE